MPPPVDPAHQPQLPWQAHLLCHPHLHVKVTLAFRCQTLDHGMMTCAAWTNCVLRAQV